MRSTSLEKLPVDLSNGETSNCKLVSLILVLPNRCSRFLSETVIPKIGAHEIGGPKTGFPKRCSRFLYMYNGVPEFRVLETVSPFP